MAYVTSFTKNQEFISASQGYSPLLYQYYQGQQEDFEFGINMSFMITHPEHTIWKHIKPRFYLHGNSVTFFNYELGFTRSSVIDTLRFVEPNVDPVLIDSVTSGRLRYSYTSEQFFAEVGANVDVIRLRYFNFYVGLLYGQGVNFNTTFSVDKTENYQIDRYPDQKKGESGILSSFKKTEKQNTGFSSRVSIPIGVQHRFSRKKKGSLGLFGELRPALEFFSVKEGVKTKFTMLCVSAGLRWSFERHK